MKQRAKHIRKFQKEWLKWKLTVFDKTFCGKNLKVDHIAPLSIYNSLKDIESKATCKTCISLMNTGKPA